MGRKIIYSTFDDYIKETYLEKAKDYMSRYITYDYENKSLDDAISELEEIKQGTLPIYIEQQEKIHDSLQDLNCFSSFKANNRKRINKMIQAFLCDSKFRLAPKNCKILILTPENCLFFDYLIEIYNDQNAKYMRKRKYYEIDSEFEEYIASGMYDLANNKFINITKTMVTNAVNVVWGKPYNNAKRACDNFCDYINYMLSFAITDKKKNNQIFMQIEKLIEKNDAELYEIWGNIQPDLGDLYFKPHSNVKKQKK